MTRHSSPGGPPSMSKRSQRRRQKSADRREAARLAAPAMLEAEAQRRNSLDDLLKRSIAFGRHVELDKRLQQLNANAQEITDRLRESFAAYERDVHSLMLIELAAVIEGVERPPSSAEDRRRLTFNANDGLTAAEAAFEDLADVYVEMTHALLQRADLKLGGITRAELELKLEEVATRGDGMEAELARARETMDKILSKYQLTAAV